LDEYFTDEARLCVILSNLEANYTFKLGKVLVILPVALCELLNLNLCSIRMWTDQTVKRTWWKPKREKGAYVIFTIILYFKHT